MFCAYMTKLHSGPATVFNWRAACYEFETRIWILLHFFCVFLNKKILQCKRWIRTMFTEQKLITIANKPRVSPTQIYGEEYILI